MQVLAFAMNFSSFIILLISSCIDYEEHSRVGRYIDYLLEITNLVVGVLVRES
jgi:hypothetical protein